MKGVISLGLICLLACSVTSTGSHSRNSHVSLSREADDCEFQCRKAPDSDENSDNWFVEVEKNIYLIYNAENNFLAVFNKNLQFSFFYLSDGYIAIVNHQDGGIILANLKADVAIFVKGSGSLSVDVVAAINAAFDVIVANKGKLTGDVDVTDGYVFRLSWILELDVKLKGRAFLVDLKYSFEGFFKKVDGVVKSGVIAFEVGVHCLFIQVIIPATTKVLAALKNVMLTVVTYTVELTSNLVNILVQGVRIGGKKGKEILGNLAKSIAGTVGGLYNSTKEAVQSWTGDKAIASSISRFVTYGGKNLTARLTLKFDLSWSFEISSNQQLANKVLVLYDATTNVFSYRNYKTNMMLVFTGKDRKYGLFNTATGAAIVVEYKRGFLDRETGAATFVDKNDKLALAIRENNVNDIQVTVKKIINDTQVPKKPDFYIIDVIQGKTSGISGDLLVKLEANFGLLLKLHDKSKEGQFALIYFVFGDLDVKVFSLNFVTFQKAILNILRGYYNRVLMANCAISIQTFFIVGFVGDMLGSVINKILDTVKSTITSLAGKIESLFSANASFEKYQTASVDVNYSLVIRLEASASVQIDPAVSRKLEVGV